MSITISLKQGDENRDVVIPTEWTDMTLEYWCGMYMVIKRHQDLADLKNDKKKKDEKESADEYWLKQMVEKEDLLEKFDNVRLNKDLFAYMTGLSEESMELTDINSVNSVIGVLDGLVQEYKPKGVDSFEFEEETYYFPKEFLKKNTYGDYIEATQLEMYIDMMKHGRFDVLPEQMAILCRRADEKYDDEKIPEKAEKFKQLTMDTVWEFSFFLSNQNRKLAEISLTFSEKGSVAEVQE